jgi:hypothetical protein
MVNKSSGKRKKNQGRIYFGGIIDLSLQNKWTQKYEVERNFVFSRPGLVAAFPGFFQ